jgi:hypothetical protein
LQLKLSSSAAQAQGASVSVLSEDISNEYIGFENA